MAPKSKTLETLATLAPTVAAETATATVETSAPVVPAAPVADDPADTDTDTDEPAGFVAPKRVRMGLGDGAVFAPKRPGGDTSIRVGVIEYELSPSMRVHFAIYRRVREVGQKGGTLSIAMPSKGVVLHGIDKSDAAVGAWLESETAAWLAWFRVHGSKLPTKTAATRGFSGISIGADDEM